MISLKYIGIKALSLTDFDVKGVKASTGAFPIGIENDYLSEGRQRYLIHLLTDGTRIYKTASETATISSGTLVLLPHGTKYYTVSVDAGKPSCKGLSVIFDIVDECGKPIQLENTILHLRHDSRGVYSKLCLQMLKCTLEQPDNILEMKSLLLRLLSEIAKDDKRTPPPSLAPAFELLRKQYKENLPVKEYADMCHMSESYFRKKFTEFTGKSPIQYRNELRFAEARRLYSEGATVSEIATELGFFDVGYFSKMYKKSNGRPLRDETEKDMI